jgi:xylulokinase
MDVTSAAALAPVHTGVGWSEEQLAAVAVRADQMPDVEGLGEAVGTLDAGGVVGSGLVDALGEQLVAGAADPGDVLVMCGTTLMTWAITGEYREAAPLWVMPNVAAPTTFMVGGPSNAGGMFVDWVRRLTGDAPAADGDPDRIPVWAPYPRGERTPLHDPDRRATLHALDLTHGPAEVMRAGLEAAAFVVRHHLDLADTAPRRIVATGGGTRSVAWMQALADGTGLPVHVAEHAEGAAMGSAWVARMAAGLEADLQAGTSWAGTSQVVEPRAAWHEAMQPRYEQFRGLTAGRLP